MFFIVYIVLCSPRAEGAVMFPSVEVSQAWGSTARWLDPTCNLTP